MKNPVGYAIKEAMMLVAYWPKLGSPGENEGMYWTCGITFTVHGDPGERWFFLDGMHYWFDQDFFPSTARALRRKRRRWSLAARGSMNESRWKSSLPQSISAQ